VSGTSAAAPLWAALAARLNDYCEAPYDDAAPSYTLGFLNPVLYQIAAEGEPGFHDITQGNNSYSATGAPQYPATPGYDMATGLGSPDATELAQSICGAGAPVISTNGLLSLPDGTVGQPYSTELTTADHRAGTWVVRNGSLPSGLSLSGYTISGTPTAPSSLGFGLTFTDTNDRTASAWATIDVAGSGNPGGSSGNDWVATEAPLPAGWGDPYMDSSSCDGAGTCIAVGNFDTPIGSDNFYPLIETYSDGTWTATEAPLPANAGNDPSAQLVSSSCGGPGSCVAVGDINLKNSSDLGG